MREKTNNYKVFFEGGLYKVNGKKRSDEGIDRRNK
jgi:hypothetical protein